MLEIFPVWLFLEVLAMLYLLFVVCLLLMLYVLNAGVQSGAGNVRRWKLAILRSPH